MADLRLENIDGEYLLLSLPTGETHRLVVDDALRRAVRREAISSDDSNLISPREIQLEVRSGVTIDDLVQKTGASLDYIQKFAAPVIDELAHVVKSALSVRITMAGDRYSETTQVEFGEVIANRLATQGVVTYAWSARRSDNGGWQLTCKYDDASAVWAFDSRKLALSPENELAVGLSTQQSLTDGPIPRLRSVTELGSESSVALVTEAAPVLTAPQVVLAPVSNLVEPVVQEAESEQESEPVQEAKTEVVGTPQPPAWEPQVEESQLPKPRQAPQPERLAPVTHLTADLGQTVEFDGVVTFGRSVSDGTTSEGDSGESLANTADLLDALRRRRLEREQDVLSTNTGAIGLGDLTDLSVEEGSADASDDTFDGVDDPAPDTLPIGLVSNADDAEAIEPEKPKKSARPSMPSWDEIVFNTRNDD